MLTLDGRVIFSDWLLNSRPVGIDGQIWLGPYLAPVVWTETTDAYDLTLGLMNSFYQVALVQTHPLYYINPIGNGAAWFDEVIWYCYDPDYLGDWLYGFYYGSPDPGSGIFNVYGGFELPSPLLVLGDMEIKIKPTLYVSVIDG